MKEGILLFNLLVESCKNMSPFNSTSSVEREQGFFIRNRVIYTNSRIVEDDEGRSC